MNSKRIPVLSKSKYLAGLQCPLRLWHQCFNPSLASPVSPTQQALFDTTFGSDPGRSRLPGRTSGETARAEGYAQKPSSRHSCPRRAGDWQYWSQ